MVVSIEAEQLVLHNKLTIESTLRTFKTFPFYNLYKTRLRIVLLRHPSMRRSFVVIILSTQTPFLFSAP